MPMDNILEAMSSAVRGRFEEIYGQHYNPNVKGSGYEKIVRAFLENYLEGRYSFHERCSLLDTPLTIGTVFSAAENEWDVVGTFKNAVPNIVLNREGSPIVPYDAAAFIVAVEQTLTQAHLQMDLDRYVRLGDLEYAEPSVSVGGKLTVNHPLRILFYYEGTPKQEQLMTLTISHRAWDIAISFKGESFLANGNLPLTKHLVGETDKPLFRPSSRHVLPWLLLYITSCSPQPLRRDISNLLFNLLKRDLQKNE